MCASQRSELSGLKTEIATHRADTEALEARHNAAMSDLLDMKLEGVSSFSSPVKTIGKSVRTPGSKESRDETSVVIAALAELAAVQGQLAAKNEENLSLKKLVELVAEQAKSSGRRSEREGGGLGGEEEEEGEGEEGGEGGEVRVKDRKDWLESRRLEKLALHLTGKYTPEEGEEEVAFTTESPLSYSISPSPRMSPRESPYPLSSPIPSPLITADFSPNSHLLASEDGQVGEERFVPQLDSIVTPFRPSEKEAPRDEAGSTKDSAALEVPEGVLEAAPLCTTPPRSPYKGGGGVYGSGGWHGLSGGHGGGAGAMLNRLTPSHPPHRSLSMSDIGGIPVFYDMDRSRDEETDDNNTSNNDGTVSPLRKPSFRPFMRTVPVPLSAEDEERREEVGESSYIPGVTAFFTLNHRSFLRPPPPLSFSLPYLASSYLLFPTWRMSSTHTDADLVITHLFFS